MKNDSYRIPMPIVDVDQAFATAAELEHVLASLHGRAEWFLSTRSSAEADEKYSNLGVYIWTVKVDDEYVTHVELAERRHALSHYPEDALFLAFEGTWKLRDVETAIKSDDWIAYYLVLGVNQFLDKHTDGSIH
ncbi:hypothetical protein [Agrobacterium tumefaciens]|uniref:hypothetical protein n=1 Tax=Agrobacterium tumefaciens TaxID=358 RepID=UPI00285CD4B8|nr:hypothetical protein [Agrobacterium tumefaciens]MDR6587421.1 hypothetical protein [Agrobacterium tumefaciens]